MTPDAFGLLRVGEFYEAILAFREKEKADRTHMGELVRGATLRLWNLQVSKKDRIVEPSKFWRMPWDEAPHDASEEVARLSPEDRERSLENMKRIMGLSQDGKR